LYLIFQAGYGMAQEQPRTFRLWQLTSYTGSVGVNGFYRQQERTVNDIRDYSTFPFITGNLLLNTTSYIGHPNLFLLEVGGEYNPGSSQQTYTVSPDRSEVLTFTRLNLRGTLFSGKPMSLGATFNLGRNFINREYVTSLRTDSRQWGLTYNFTNKILPLTVTYSDRKWDQLELETDRTYRNKQEDLQARVSRSFTRFGDNSELRYVYYTFFREDQNLIQTNTINSQFILNNTFYFDEYKRYMFRSAINTLDQQGNINQKRFQAFETVNFSLPFNLRFTGNYDFINLVQETQSSRQHRVNVGLEHQLFASLRTGINYEYYNTDHTAFKETNTRYGVNLNYIKKIPTGSLNLGYSYRRHNQNVVSDPNNVLQIIDEPHVLADGQVILLDRPYVDLTTVVVKDVTGAIIYQRDFDYLLFERNEFVEVVRIAGGQIANNSPVLVDYIATQVGSYNFDADFQSFNVSVNLFNHLVELYYNTTIQDYENVEDSEFLTLNYFIRNIYGTRFQLGIFTAGAEWDDYNSTIVPYQKLRFYLRMNGKLGKKILLSLNGDFSDLTLTENNIKQLYASTYGKVVYQIKARSKVNLDLGYRKQVGEQIDLDLITAKLEYNTVFRNLYMKVGVEVYKRNYIDEKLNFRGVYFRIDRRF
jgi:hypothetical protein